MTLYAHQKKAVERFQDRHSGALFHAPGLGKTLTAVTLFQQWRAKGLCQRLLVICPLSLVNAAWGADIEKFTDLTWSYKFDWTKADIVIVNYEKFISKKYFDDIKRHLHHFACVIDESSRMKNHNTITTRKLIEIAALVKPRIILSGTPCPNGEVELWGQGGFIGAWGDRFNEWRRRYFHLGRGAEVFRGQIYSRQAAQEMFKRGWKWTCTNREAIMAELAPFADWRTKEECLDLPDKIEEIREITLTAEEKRIYDRMKREMIVEVQGHEVAATVALTKLGKLR